MDESAPGQSMEDILASIRQVISADADAARHLRSAMPPPPEEEEEDILELGQMASDDEAPVPDSVENHVEEASKEAPAALDNIAIDPGAGANTLDGMVREMLRPMVKEWLDAHLPELVAREVARTVGR